MSSDTERARRVLDALGATSPDQLRAAAAVSPAPVAGLLAGVADALESPDPAAALARVMGGAAADTAGAAKLLHLLSGVLGAELDTVAATATAAEGPLAEVDEVRRAFVARGGPPEGADAELARLMERALDIAGDEAPVRAVRSALAETRSLAEVTKDVLDEARRDPDKAAQAAATLEARVKGLEKALGHAEDAVAGVAKVLPLVSDLRALAETRGRHDAAAQLALVQAGLEERMRGLGDAGVQARWQAVFDAAERAGLVPLARTAGQRLQMVAIERGDLTRVAVLAHRTADLARARGDVRAEVFARLEEVVALARLPDHRDDARAMIGDVIARAEQTGERLLAARARLTQGQLLEQLGDTAAARVVYRDLLTAAKADPSFPREVGRAALHLGRLELANNQPAAGRKHLTLALVIARNLGEWLLYAPTNVALIEHHADRDERVEVGQLLRELAAQAPRLGGAQGQRTLDAVVDELVERWGRPVVDALLAGT